MNYTQAKNYIDDCYKRGSVYGLESIRALVGALDNPQNGQKIIHIAGTNGKGSVGAFISSVLQRAGYKVGRFVSPTIYCYEERFQINGSYIKNVDFAHVMTLVRAAADKISFEPTGFELETAAALCYFKMERCDVSIIECGLGGRNDATNVIDNNMLTVLTSISLDHTALLGSTTAEIAEEKCGIIKAGAQVVSACQNSAAEAVIKKHCEQSSAPCLFVNNADILNRKYTMPYQSFDFEKYKSVETSMLGEYQFENAALALKCIDVLKETGFNITDESIYLGMREAHWGGRFEIIGSSPVFILDGAHNPDAAQRLKNSLDLYFCGCKFNFIIGVFADKDYDGILKITAPLADKIFAVKAPSPRGLDTSSLAAAALKYNDSVVQSSLKEAVACCKEQKDRVTAVFGSLSFMGEITGYIKEQ